MRGTDWKWGALGAERAHSRVTRGQEEWWEGQVVQGGIGRDL